MSSDTRPRVVLGMLLVLFVAGALVACGGDEGGSDSEEGSLSGTVAINNSGGDITTVSEDVWWQPLEEETGLSVTDSAPADFTKLQAQVDSGNVIWDLAELETGGQYLQAVDLGLLEELDRQKLQGYLDQLSNGKLDLRRDFPRGTIGTHGTWYTPYATILVFDKREFPDSGPQPNSLSDLWNFEEFPGRRCLSGTAQYNLEIALRADGLDQDSIYPVDVDRALAKLDELKPEVAKFWREGAEPIQLVSDSECVMSTVWNGRPFSAAVLEGVDHLGIAWDEGILHASRWVIPKGAPNLEGAYAALAYFLTTDVGVGFAEGTGYASVNEHVVSEVAPQVRPFLASNPENQAGLTVQDDQWWLDNGPATEETFAEWIQE